MTYEEEQIKYAEELQHITKELKGFDEIFMDPNKSYSKIVDLYKRGCVKKGTASFIFDVYGGINMFRNIKQSPDFHKPGLCYVKKF